MGKAVENKGTKTAAGKAPAKQPAPVAKKVKSASTTKKKASAEAEAEAVVADLLKVAKTAGKAKKVAGSAQEKPTKTKTVAKKGGKKNGAVEKKSGGRDGLHIPKEIRRRFLRRAGNVRVSDSVLGPLDEVSQEIADEAMLLCVRAAVLAGRSTVQPKDFKRALDILGVHIY